jgi:hypothetical protein
MVNGTRPMNPNDHPPGNPGRESRNNREKGIHCFSCRHFYITYDPRFPYGCRAVGFKSRGVPAAEVRANSGMDCQFFAARE